MSQPILHWTTGKSQQWEGRSNSGTPADQSGMTWRLTNPRPSDSILTKLTGRCLLVMTCRLGKWYSSGWQLQMPAVSPYAMKTTELTLMRVRHRLPLTLDGGADYRTDWRLKKLPDEKVWFRYDWRNWQWRGGQPAAAGDWWADNSDDDWRMVIDAVWWHWSSEWWYFGEDPRQRLSMMKLRHSGNWQLMGEIQVNNIE